MLKAILKSDGCLDLRKLITVVHDILRSPKVQFGAPT